MVEQQISGRDVIAGIFRRWHLLVLAPVAGAIGFYLAAQMLPKLYTSEVLFKLDEAQGKMAESLLRSNTLIDQAVAVAYAGQPGVNLPSKRRELNRRMRWIVSRSYDRTASGIFQLEVDAESPERAQKLAGILVDKWFEFNKPQDTQRREILWRIEQTEAMLANVNELIERLKKESADALIGAFRNEVASPIEDLYQRQTKLRSDLRSLKVSLEGASRDVVISRPTLPGLPSWPDAMLTALLGGVGTFILVLLYTVASLVLRGSTSAAQQRDASVSTPRS